MRINSACHSGISYSKRCPELAHTSEADNLTSAYYRYFYRHKLVNVSICVLDVYFPSVDSGFEGSGSAGSLTEDDTSTSGSSSLGTIGIIVVVVVITGIVIIGVIVYIVVRKCYAGRELAYPVR
jgi:uncharacterized membrane protein YdbT with pleckstrin-like domain